MGYTRDQLRRCEGAEVPDLIAAGCKLLFVGINPGLWTAATGIHFAHPSNRFYPALLLAGITDVAVDVDPPTPSIPLKETAQNEAILGPGRARLLERGIGITNLVRRATARASELSTGELRAGGTRLCETVERHRPAVVAVAGVTAYRSAFGAPKAKMGPQSEDLAGARLWVVPNPSGLNAHETVASLADRYREAAVAAGVVS